MGIVDWVVYLLMIISALVIHEAGHALIMVQKNIRIDYFSLGIGPGFKLHKKLKLGIFPIGAAVCPIQSDWLNACAKTKLEIALAGPISNITTAICFGGVSILTGSAAYLSFSVIHIGVAVYNLLPIPPMDGWVIVENFRVLRGKPLSDSQVMLAARLGNGVIYAIGFYVLSKLI